jgi:acyl transferase domain-containing protein
MEDYQIPGPSYSTHDAAPIAIVGMACRLPGSCSSPQALWDLLKKGKRASNAIPASRFNKNAHFDGSARPETIRSSGGCFLENINLDEFDASFFDISREEAVSMDPQQRLLLEVVYECLENAGISLDDVDGQQMGCFVGSYACGRSRVFYCVHHDPFVSRENTR